jgi:hypothetical protein
MVRFTIRACHNHQEEGILMGDLLCKLWNFVLEIFGQVVDFVAQALTTVGTAIVDVLGELLTSAGSALSDIFSANPIFTIGLVGLGLWWLLGAGDDDEPVRQSRGLSTVKE